MFPSKFIKFCEKEGISLEHPDDYTTWLDCYKEGMLDGHHKGFRDGFEAGRKNTLKAYNIHEDP